MAKEILTAKVLDHNIVGLVAHYWVRITHRGDKVMHQEIDFEVILRETSRHWGGISCENALAIHNSEEILIEVNENEHGEFDIRDITSKEKKEFHMRNTLRL